MFQLKASANRGLKTVLMGAAAVVLSATAAHAYDFSGSGYFSYDGGMGLEGPSGPVGPSSTGGFTTTQTIEGISQNTVRSLHGGFSEIPPDTMGAVGASQFFETTNGAYAVYDKTTGVQTKLWRDGDFWQQAGQPAMNGFAGFSNGDSRVMFDKTSGKWVVTSFGASLDKVAIAVSDTSDALGSWHSTVITGFSGGIADYPTLAMDSKAVYIGTNDFHSDGTFYGTTLNVIGRDDVFGAGGPTATSLVQFNTAYGDNAYLGQDTGFAIQGVNQVNGTDAGRIEAIGIANYGPTTYDINNPGTLGATRSATTLIDPLSAYQSNQMALQPDGSRTVDTLDDRISSAVFEYNGKIYSVHTQTPLGGDHTELVWYVVDAATPPLIQKGKIGDGVHDFFQGAITVSSNGEVVISYNESGADMNISVFAQAFQQLGTTGKLFSWGGPQLLFTSPIGDYHNGSCQTCAPAGRQRWGDYAQVTVDPSDPSSFWVVGEFARPYDSFKSFSRWGTEISQLGVAGVPEPASWAMLISGFFGLGAFLRRRRGQALAA